MVLVLHIFQLHSLLVEHACLGRAVPIELLRRLLGQLLLYLQVVGSRLPIQVEQIFHREPGTLRLGIR
jgi:hypothetical protein